MYCVKKMTDDLYWVGGSDRRLALFENVYPIPNGVSYNAYLLLDEKTVLLDTVDRSIADLFFENVAHVLNGRKLDYVIVNHMEPDHCAVLQDLVLRYPEVKIVCNAKTVTMIRNFFTFDIDSRAMIVKEMDTLCTGRHTFAFVMAPMVHWPEAMVSYDATTKTLFSADAFGTFGALNGNLYADEVNFKTEYLPTRGGITPTSSANTVRRCRRCLKRRPPLKSRPSARSTARSGGRISRGSWTNTSIGRRISPRRPPL